MAGVTVATVVEATGAVATEFRLLDRRSMVVRRRL